MAGIQRSGLLHSVVLDGPYQRYVISKGRALYTDVDMINFRDISNLFDVDLKNKPFGSRVVKARNISFPSFNFSNLMQLKNPIKIKRFSGFQPCVMLIDCEKAKDFLDPVSHQKN